MPSKSVQNKIIVVSGAGSGIGAALCEELTGGSYTVVGLGRDVTSLRSLQRLLRERGSFIPVQCDIRSEGETTKAFKRIKSHVGNVDVLINNAGVTYFKEFLQTSSSQFDEILDTNLRGMFLLAKIVLPSMIRRRAGLIVNILSFAAKTIYTGSSIYSASKSGASAMMNVLREEVRDKNIKIVNVYPGAVSTPMWSREHRKRFGKKMIEPRIVASLVSQAIRGSQSMMLEEIVLRPQAGDLKV